MELSVSGLFRFGSLASSLDDPVGVVRARYWLLLTKVRGQENVRFVLSCYRVFYSVLLVSTLSAVLT